MTIFHHINDCWTFNLHSFIHLPWQPMSKVFRLPSLLSVFQVAMQHHGGHSEWGGHLCRLCFRLRCSAMAGTVSEVGISVVCVSGSAAAPWWAQWVRWASLPSVFQVLMQRHGGHSEWGGHLCRLCFRFRCSAMVGTVSEVGISAVCVSGCDAAPWRAQWVRWASLPSVFQVPMQRHGGHSEWGGHLCRLCFRLRCSAMAGTVSEVGISAVCVSGSDAAPWWAQWVRWASLPSVFQVAMQRHGGHSEWGGHLCRLCFRFRCSAMVGTVSEVGISAVCVSGCDAAPWWAQWVRWASLPSVFQVPMQHHGGHSEWGGHLSRLCFRLRCSAMVGTVTEVGISPVCVSGCDAAPWRAQWVRWASLPSVFQVPLQRHGGHSEWGGHLCRLCFRFRCSAMVGTVSEVGISAICVSGCDAAPWWAQWVRWTCLPSVFQVAMQRHGGHSEWGGHLCRLCFRFRCSAMAGTVSEVGISAVCVSGCDAAPW